MAIAVSLLDYTPGLRNTTLYLGLTFSGSYTVGGDALNLASVANPNGLEGEGAFRVPLNGGPGVFFENLDGYYVQPVVEGVTSPANYKLQVFAPGGSELTAEAYPSAITSGSVVLVATQRSCKENETINFDGFLPHECTRFGGLVDNDDPTVLPMGVAAVCKNCRFQLTTVATRFGLQTAMQGPNQAPIYRTGRTDLYTGEPWRNSIPGSHALRHRWLSADRERRQDRDA